MCIVLFKYNLPQEKGVRLQLLENCLLEIQQKKKKVLRLRREKEFTLNSNLDTTLLNKRDLAHIFFHCHDMGQNSSFGQNQREENRTLPSNNFRLCR